MKFHEGYGWGFVFAILWFFSIIYRGIITLRKGLFFTGVFRTRRLSCRVISVGNITVGGAGKTPMVEYLARTILNEHMRVAVLSRGYGGKGKGLSWVSNGKEMDPDPDIYGDELCMMANRLPGISIIKDADRYKAGAEAIKRYGVDMIILDDGFQYHSLKKDLEVLILNGSHPFDNGYLIPRGGLREPIKGIRRADCIVAKGEIDNVHMQTIRRYNPNAPIFLAEFQYGPWRMLGGNVVISDSDGFLDSAVFAFSGIGSPEQFFQDLRSMGFRIAGSRSFPDHYIYNSKDVMSLEEEAKEKGAAYLVTTCKDEVKLVPLLLPTSNPIWSVMEARMGFVKGEEDFQRLIQEVIDGSK